MVLSRGGSNTEQTGGFERARVEASAILRYAKSYEAAIQNMQLNNVAENAISFENTITATDYSHARCDDAADRNFPECQVFDVEGAGLTYRNFNGAQTTNADWIFTGANNVGTTARPVGTTADGTGNDLLMLLPNIDETTCIQINRELGVGTSGTVPVDTTGIDTTAFTGAYPTGGPTLLDGDPTPFELDGENAGCFFDDNTDIRYFYQVILAR